MNEPPRKIALVVVVFAGLGTASSMFVLLYVKSMLNLLAWYNNTVFFFATLSQLKTVLVVGSVFATFQNKCRCLTNARATFAQCQDLLHSFREETVT